MVHRTLHAGLSGHHALDLVTASSLESTLSLLDDNNYNLSEHEKELLLWHCRLGHAGFAWIQTLMRQRKPTAHEPNPPLPIVMTRTTGAYKCAHPKCPACQLSKQHRCSAKSQRIATRPEREMAIKRDDVAPGDCVSIDQHISKTPGRLVHTQGRESAAQQCSGGTIFRPFVCHASRVFANTLPARNRDLECKVMEHNATYHNG